MPFIVVNIVSSYTYKDFMPLFFHLPSEINTYIFVDVGCKMFKQNLYINSKMWIVKI